MCRQGAPPECRDGGRGLPWRRVRTGREVRMGAFEGHSAQPASTGSRSAGRAPYWPGRRTGSLSAGRCVAQGVQVGV